jgi:DNA-binding MarR family transcriptional regulator
VNDILESRTLEDVEPAALARLGELLFGRALRLRVAAWVAARQDVLFFQGEAAKGVDYSASAVIQELDRLVELGMLVRLPRQPGDRRQYYTRTDSQLWAAVAAAVTALPRRRPAG